MSDASEISRMVAGEVRAWLGRRNLSATQAAAQLGWAQSYLAHRLTGAQRFNVEDLAALGELLGVAPGVFFDAPEPVTLDFQRAGGTPPGRSRRPGFSMPRSPATVAA